MTVLLPTYTLTIYEEDDETVLLQVSTDPAHQAPYLRAFDNFPEQEIDFVKGSASIGQMVVQIVDVANDPLDQATGYLTGVLADPSGRSQLIGHRALAEQDVGSGRETVLDGIVRGVRLLDHYSGYALDLRDIRERERATTAFETTSTPTVMPRGVLDGYGVTIPTGPFFGGSVTSPIPRTPPLVAVYHALSSSHGEVRLNRPLDTPGNPLASLILTDPMREALDSTKPLSGSPDILVYDRWQLLWRVGGSGSAYNVVPDVAAQHPSLPARGQIPISSAVDELSALRVNNYVSLVGLPADGQAIDVIVQYTGPVTNDWPLHLQNLTVGELLRNLYRGDYSTTDPRIRFDEPALLALTTPVRAIIKEPIKDLREWAEKNCYPIAHAAPTLNDAGEISPVTYVLPDATVTVPTLSDSNCRPAGGGWSHSAQDAVNVVTVKYRRDFRMPPEQRAGVALSDQILEREIEHEFRDRESVALNGEQKLEIDAILLRAIGGARGVPLTGDTRDETGANVARTIAFTALERLTLGGQYFALDGRRTDADVEALRVGDYVIVSTSWQPDYLAARRGASRLAQVLGRRNKSAAWTTLTLLDTGSAAAPLAQPTLGTVTIDSAGIVSVPVTALAEAGVFARVEFAVSAIEPDPTSSLWVAGERVEYTSVGTPTTVTSDPIPPGTTAWVRARSEGGGRRPSGWTTPVSVTATTVARLVDAALTTDQIAVGTLTWRGNSFTPGLRLRFAVHDVDDVPTLSASVDVDASLGSHVFSALRVPRGKALTVEAEPWTGWTGSAVSGTAGTSVTLRTDGVLEPIAPWVQADFDRDAEAESATLTLSVRDPHGSITAIEHSRREGSRAGDQFGAYSPTWDTAPTPPPYDGTWTTSVAVPPGEESAIRWRITFVDIAGIERTIGSTHYTSQIDEHEAQIRVFFAGGVLMDNDSENAPDDTQLQAGVVQPTTLLFPVWVRNELHLQPGAEVVALRARVYNEDGPTLGSDHDSVVAHFQVHSNTGGVGSSTQVNSAAGGWQTVENLLLSHTIVDTESYFIDCTVRSDDDLTHARAIWGEVDVIRHSVRET